MSKSSNSTRTVASVAGPVRITAVRGLTTPDAFNAAILADGCRYLIAYRPRMNEGLGYALLDGGFEVIRGTAGEIAYQRNEDPRLIRDIDGSILMSTNYWESGYVNNRIELRRMALDEAAGRVSLDEVKHLGKFDTVQGWPGYCRKTEKNWTPFVSSDLTVQIVYSIRPHRVLEYDRSSCNVSLVSTADWCLPSWWSSQWGDHLRGSAPPVRWNNAWLSTWHTATREGYWTGFYTFAADPPYHPLTLTEPVLLPTFSTESNRIILDRQNVFYVNGLIAQENRLLLSGGDNDHSAIVVEISRAEVAGLLRPLRI